jgi:outer membrane protein assembly factor BamE
MQKYLIILGIISIFTLTACSNFGFPGVYRIQIQQGNIIDDEDIEELRIGMTKTQVEYLMGTPLVADTFHLNRWDYYYSLRDAEGETTQKRISLLFKGDLLNDIQRSWTSEATEEKVETPEKQDS